MLFLHLQYDHFGDILFFHHTAQKWGSLEEDAVRVDAITGPAAMRWVLHMLHMQPGARGFCTVNPEACLVTCLCWQMLCCSSIMTTSHTSAWHNAIHQCAANILLNPDACNVGAAYRWVRYYLAHDNLGPKRFTTAAHSVPLDALQLLDMPPAHLTAFNIDPLNPMAIQVRCTANSGRVFCGVVVLCIGWQAGV